MVLFQSSDERSGDKLVVVNVSTLSPEDVNGSTYRNTVIFLLRYETVGKAQES